MTDLAIQARGLTKRYGETVALGGIDLDGADRHRHAVLGPNGAGKTTAVRILTTLAEPDERRGHRGRLRRGAPSPRRSGAASAWPPRTPRSTRS